MRTWSRAPWIAAATFAVIALVISLRAGRPDVTPRDAGAGGVESVVSLGERLLVIDGLVRGSVDPATGECLFPSAIAAGLARRLFAEPGRALFIGIGDGAPAKAFASEGWRVTAIEPDPRAAWAAAWHGGLDPGDATLVLGEPRALLAAGGEESEIVIVSDWADGGDPGSLFTREAVGALASRLAPGGVLVMDVESIGWRSRLVRSIAATLSERFEQVVALPTMEPRNNLGRVVLMAADRPIELPTEPENPIDRFAAQYHLVHAWANRFVPDAENAAILTDGRNPAGRWTAEARARSRERLAERLGENGS